MKQFVLGGARSGKSRYAEQLASATEKQVVYIATATAGDNEMQQRINLHQQQRPDHWLLVEEPLQLANALRQYDQPEYCLLVDCLTLWLSNCLATYTEQEVEQQQSEFLDAIALLKADVIVVSNEVGQGIVPLGELTRKFVDESGRMHQKLAEVCHKVFFVTAGIAQKLK